MTNKIYLAIIAVLLVVGVVLFLNRDESKPILGGSGSGQEVLVPQFFYDGLYGKKFTQAGDIYAVIATTTQATTSLTQSDLTKYSVIRMVASTTPAQKLHLPATSTLTTLIQKPGDFRTWIIFNDHTDAATTTTVFAGNGITVESASTTNNVAAGKSATLTLFRLSTGDVRALLVPSR